MQNKRIALTVCLILSACSTHTSFYSREDWVAAEMNAQLGIAYLVQNNNVQRAKLKLLIAQKQAPHDPMIFYSMGYFQEKTGNLSEAEQSYLHAIELDPHHGASRNNYGTFLCRQGRYRKAIQYFLSAIQDPAYLSVAQAYENAGRCALQIPDKKAAEKYFHLAVQKNSL